MFDGGSTETCGGNNENMIKPAKRIQKWNMAVDMETNSNCGNDKNDNNLKYNINENENNDDDQKFATRTTRTNT